MTNNYHKFNSMVAPVIAAGLDVVPMLEQISICAATWCAAIHLASPFSSIHFSKVYQKQFALSYQGQQDNSTVLSQGYINSTADVII